MNRDTALKFTDDELQMLAAAMTLYHAKLDQSPIAHNVKDCQYFIDAMNLQDRINSAVEDAESDK